MNPETSDLLPLTRAARAVHTGQHSAEHLRAHFARLGIRARYLILEKLRRPYR